jgi:hypothetical protein
VGDIRDSSVHIGYLLGHLAFLPSLERSSYSPGLKLSEVKTETIFLPALRSEQYGFSSCLDKRNKTGQKSDNNGTTGVYISVQKQYSPLP